MQSEGGEDECGESVGDGGKDIGESGRDTQPFVWGCWVKEEKARHPPRVVGYWDTDGSV